MFVAAALASVLALAVAIDSVRNGKAKFVGNVYRKSAIAKDGYPAYNEESTPA